MRRIIAVHQSMIKKAKKWEFTEQKITVFMDDVKIKIDELNVSKNKSICIYNLYAQDCSIYHG